MQVIVNGLLTTYSRAGTGKQVLVLHGWGDSAAGWGQFMAALSKKYDVIVPDLPGFGGTQSPPRAWGLTEYADFVAAYIKKLGIEPAAVIGHSNGGAIAVRGLAHGLISTDKLLLLASAGIRGEYNGRNKALRLVTKTGKLLTKPLPQKMKKQLRRKVYTAVGSDMLVAEHLQETFKKVVTDDVRDDAARVGVLTLLLYGDQDDQTPVAFGRLFHEVMAGSTLEILTGAGHFLYRTNEPAVIKLVEDFIE